MRALEAKLPGSEERPPKGAPLGLRSLTEDGYRRPIEKRLTPFLREIR